MSQLGRSVCGRYLFLRYRRRDDDGGPRPSTDYVLIARPGIGPAAEAQGFDWLCGQVEELLRAVEPEPVA